MVKKELFHLQILKDEVYSWWYPIKTIEVSQPMPNVPSYMLIRQYVIEMVLRHPDSALPLPSERMLCETFRVSRTTVRNALRDLVKDGYLEARQGKGMFLKPGHNFGSWNRFYKILLLIGDGKYTYFDGFYMRQLRTIFQTLESLPVRIQMIALNCDREEAVGELGFYSPDGVLWIQPPGSFEPVIRECRNRFPVQVISGTDPEDCNNVVMDYRAGGRMAARWFFEGEMMRPALIGCSKSGIRGEVFEGWREEFRARGIRYSNKWSLPVDEVTEARLAQLLNEEKPDGIFAFGTEFNTVDAVFAAVPACRCPVITDRTPFAEYHCTLAPAARIELSPPELAEEGAMRLFNLLDTPGTASGKLIVQPQLTVAQS